MQSPQGGRQFGEGRSIAQGARLALDDRQIVPPVVDGASRQMVGSLDDPWMFAQDPPLGGHDDALGIDPHADRTVGERRRHAVAIALQVDEAGRRDAFGVFDEPVERTAKPHQLLHFLAPGVGDRAWLRGVRDLGPQLPASRLQPVIQRRQRGKARHRLPEPMTRILHVLLDLPLLPAGGRIAELGLEQEVADHGREAGVDLTLLAPPDLVDGGAHVVVDAAPRHAAQNAEGVVVGVEQHLMGLLRISPENEGAAVGELEVGDLQLGPLTRDDRPVLRPVELERLAGQERERHECAPTGGLLLPMPGRSPLAGEGGHAIVGAVVAESHKVSMQLLRRPLLLARLPRLLSQHLRQLVGIGVKLAGAVQEVELWLDAVRAQVFAHRVPRQTGAPRDLADREMVPMPPTSNDAQ